MTATIFNFLAKRNDASDHILPQSAFPNNQTLGSLVEGLNALMQELEHFYVEMEHVLSEGAISIEDQSSLRHSQISVVTDIQTANRTLCSLLQELAPANTARISDPAETALPPSTSIPSQTFPS